jgi:biopolymer transport protein ExbB/TolQ
VRLLILLMILLVPLVVYLAYLASARSAELEEARAKLRARDRELEELSDVLLQLDAGDTAEEILRAIRARHDRERITRREAE